MSKHKKYKNEMKTFTYSIYKDGSVKVEPSNAFGWNGCANIVYDEGIKQHKLHSRNAAAEHDCERIRIDQKGILRIEHFSVSSSKVVSGTGVRC